MEEASHSRALIFLFIGFYFFSNAEMDGPHYFLIFLIIFTELDQMIVSYCFRWYSSP